MYTQGKSILTRGRGTCQGGGDLGKLEDTQGGQCLDWGKQEEEWKE